MKLWLSMTLIAGLSLSSVAVPTDAKSDQSTAVSNPKSAITTIAIGNPVPAAPPAAEPAKRFGPGVTPAKSSAPAIATGKHFPTVKLTGGDNYGVEAWRLWLLLGVLLAMLLGAFYIVRRYGRGLLPGGATDLITVKAKVQLDARNSVTLLKIYEEEFVVGSGTDGVRLLARLMPIDGVEAEPPVSEAEAGQVNLAHSAALVEKDFNARFKTIVDSEEIK